MSNSVQPHRRQPTRLPCPWDFPGKNTGVGCHFLLQCMKVKSESEVAQSCPTLSDPMDCSPPGSSVHGIFQARVLEWGAIAFSTGGLSRAENMARSHPWRSQSPGGEPGPSGSQVASDYTWSEAADLPCEPGASLPRALLPSLIKAPASLNLVPEGQCWDPVMSTRQ